MKQFLILTAAALLWAACGPSGEAQAGHLLRKGRQAYVNAAGVSVARRLL